jgi:mannose-6-phosphate isomerase-like protein (cupin superfamily)
LPTCLEAAKTHDFLAGWQPAPQKLVELFPLSWQIGNLPHKNMDIQNIDRVPAFITKDGSEIRELLAHRNSCIRNQTLAEARLPPSGSTTPHHHEKTEEIYYILEGRGLMQIGQETSSVGPGDAIAIPPGELHKITNIGLEVLKFLCCCAPGYEHEDTVLQEESM